MRKHRRIGSPVLAFFLIGGCAGETQEQLPDGSPAPENPEIHTRLGGQFLQVSVQGAEGEGALAEALFAAKEDEPVPTYEEFPGADLGCEVFEFGPDGFLPGIPDVECPHLAGAQDQGTMYFRVQGGVPDIPPCTFVPGVGYRCISVSSTGGDIGVVDPAQSLYSLRDTEVTFEEDEVGRFVRIAGASVPANNGLFPIVAAPDPSTIVFLNPQHDPEACAADPETCAEQETAATYRTLAGMPGGRTPPIDDSAQVTFELEPGGLGDVPAFTRTIDLGDRFTLDTASQARINDIPTDGSEFTLGCDGEGGSCGSASFTLLNIFTTDAPIGPAVPPVAVPPPEERALQIVCVSPGGRVTVPPEVSSYLAESGATRIRAVYMRMNDAYFVEDGLEARLGAGHAIAGVTNPAAP